ncbi:NmrA family transcriptional regulator [Phytohabitans sp. ZYX-F-186]|uniref:NmrA family transcriptional regulator n=1 Tax=Phytohabitans maris TaxID=3071409 RepID=A0ABU0ZI63_9ACTN|nr:NmrA family transcriptional regulator [Phytohabitans sp. ZYX-F-186]MDQ7906114.1 NmrA family transcriptional regulator [Phytohabitans sp. ZYX-F-186]
MTYLLIGGTGKTGRRVDDRLTARGLPVRVGSRSGRPPFDWTADPDTWVPLFEGVTAAYVTYYPDLAFPGAARSLRAFAERATAAGVRRLVLLSGRGEEEAAVSELGVRQVAAEWTVVRATWFAQDFDEHFLLPPVLAGEIALPTDVPEPFVDLEDVADVVVAALTEPGHHGQVYELTGPRLVTFAEAAAEISAASGRPVRFTRVTPEECTARMVAGGVPAEEAEALTDLFARVLDGRNAHVTDDVKRVTGHPARDFRDYVRAAAATGVWDPR